MTLSDRINQVRSPEQDAPVAPLAANVPDALARSTRHVDPFADVKQSVHQALLESLGPKLYDSRMDQQELDQRVRQTLQIVLEMEETPLTNADRTRVAQEVADEILGHGPLEPLLRDPEVTEIMVNGYDRIFIERLGRLHHVEAAFQSEAHLRRTIDKVVGRVGRRVDESTPMVDARLPDGSRVNAIVPPIALDGSSLTIRKFARDPYEAEDLVGFGTMTRAVCDLLSACVRGRLNVLISGGTGSGKTTTLNVLSGFIPEDERIVTVEDAAELQLHQEHVVRLESRPANIEGKGLISIRDLVRNALRMRPDRIVVGEVRDGAALDMLQAMNTGHDGSMTTVHANTPRDALSRIEQMIGMSGIDIAPRSARAQIASAVNIVIQIGRLSDGKRKLLSLSELTGMEGETITMQEIWRYKMSGRDEAGNVLGHFEATGIRPKFSAALETHGIHLPAELFHPGAKFNA